MKENIGLQKKTYNIFSWEGLGDIKGGRENLGEYMPVLFYRLLEYTMLDVLVNEYGPDKASELFFKAGHKAGIALAQNTLDLNKDFDGFVGQLGQVLEDNLLGILKIEEFHREKLSFILTISQDLDCSGLESTGEVVCHYDEGLISGIMEAYTGKKFSVKEVDCWANGNGTCRFRGEAI